MRMCNGCSCLGIGYSALCWHACDYAVMKLRVPGTAFLDQFSDRSFSQTILSHCIITVIVSSDPYYEPYKRSTSVNSLHSYWANVKVASSRGLLYILFTADS